MNNLKSKALNIYDKWDLTHQKKVAEKIAEIKMLQFQTEDKEEKELYSILLNDYLYPLAVTHFMQKYDYFNNQGANGVWIKKHPKKGA